MGEIQVRKHMNLRIAMTIKRPGDITDLDSVATSHEPREHSCQRVVVELGFEGFLSQHQAHFPKSIPFCKVRIIRASAEKPRAPDACS